MRRRGRQRCVLRWCTVARPFRRCPRRARAGSAPSLLSQIGRQSCARRRRGCRPRVPRRKAARAEVPPTNARRRAGSRGCVRTRRASPRSGRGDRAHPIRPGSRTRRARRALRRRVVLPARAADGFPRSRGGDGRERRAGESRKPCSRSRRGGRIVGCIWRILWIVREKRRTGVNASAVVRNVRGRARRRRRYEGPRTRRSGAGSADPARVAPRAATQLMFTTARRFPNYPYEILSAVWAGLRGLRYP